MIVPVPVTPAMVVTVIGGRMPVRRVALPRAGRRGPCCAAAMATRSLARAMGVAMVMPVRGGVGMVVVVARPAGRTWRPAIADRGRRLVIVWHGRTLRLTLSACNVGENINLRLWLACNPRKT